MKSILTKELTKSALLLSILIVVSIFITMPTMYGYLNISDAVIMISTLILSRKSVGLVAGIGCFISDMYLGYGQYAIFTFIIKFIQGYVCKLMIDKKISYYISFMICVIIMLIGYGITDIILNNSIEYFIVSISANLPQAITCYLIGILLVKPISKLVK